MDRWEDSATGAMATDEARPAFGQGVTTNSDIPGAFPGEAASAAGATASDANAQSDGWTIEVDEMRGPSRAMRAALIAGSASLAALALAGGVTWLIINRRQALNARKMQEALAASRLLRLTPSIARPDMMEATEAGANVSQHAQITAAEAARMARALGRAARRSGGVARDYASERVAAAQDALTGAYSAARDGASGAWQSVSSSSQFQPQWLIRAFNAGRYAGRMEQRMK